MFKLLKNYLHSFFKNISLLILLFIYLILFFLIIFNVTSLSFQMYLNDKHIIETSHKWEQNYSPEYHDWNVEKWDASDSTLKWMSKIKFEIAPNEQDTILNDLEEGGSNTNWITTIQLQNLDKNSEIENHNYIKECLDLLSMDAKQFESVALKININNPNSYQKVYNTPLYDNQGHIMPNITLGNIFNKKINFHIWSKHHYSLGYSIYYNGLWKQALPNFNLANDPDHYSTFCSQIYFYNHLLVTNENNHSYYKESHNNSILGDSMPSKELLTIQASDENNNISDLNFNKIVLETKDSRMPLNDHEILINKSFGKKHHWNIGDKINLFGDLFNNQTTNLSIIKKYTIVGYGINIIGTHSFYAPPLRDTLNVSHIICNIYMKQKDLGNLEYYFNLQQHKTNNFSYTVADQCFNNIKPSLLKTIDKHGNSYISSKNEDTVNNFFNISWSNSIFLKDYNQYKINFLVALILIILIIILSFIFINFNIKKDISSSKKQLRISKSIGFTNVKLSWIYTTKNFILLIMALLIAFLISIPLHFHIISLLQNKTSIYLFSLFNEKIFLICIFIIIPIIFIFVSFGFNLYYIKKTILNLSITGERSHSLLLLQFIKSFTKKKYFSTRNYILYIIQYLLKWLAITVIFCFSFSIIILQLSNIYSFNSIISSNLLGNYYNKQDGYYNNYPNKYSWSLKGADTDKYKVSVTNATSDFIDYFNFGINKHNIDSSINYWNQEITKLNNQEKSIDDIVTKDNINLFPYMNLSNLIDINNKLSKSNSEFNILLQQLSQQYVNRGNTIISLNKILYNSQNDLPYFSTKIYSENFKNSFLSKNSVNFNAIPNPSQNLTKYFNTKGLSSKQIKDITNPNPKDAPSFIPIIVSKFLSQAMDWNVGDVIRSSSKNSQIYNTYSFESSNVPNISLNFRIVGIMQTALFKPNIFCDYNNILKYFEDSNDKAFVNSNNKISYTLCNSLVSSTNAFPHLKDLIGITKTDDLNLKYFSLYSRNNYHSITSLANFFMSKKEYSYSNPYTDLVALIQTKKSASELTTEVNKMEYMIIFMLIIMIICLLIIIISITINENKKNILTLKLLGYNSKQINWLIVGNYFFGMILSFILSVLFTYNFLNFLYQYLFSNNHIDIMMHITFLIILKTALFAFVSSNIIWFVIIKKIKKDILVNIC